MSVIDTIKENNAMQAKEKQNVNLEHLAELERQRIASEGYKNPHLIAFKKRRDEQAMKFKSFATKK
jgi:hypothetical protein